MKRKKRCCNARHSCTHEEYRRIKAARQKRWRDNNIEIARELARQWAKEHPEKLREHRGRYRAKNKQNHARYKKSYEAKERRLLSDRYIALALRASCFNHYVPPSKLSRVLIEAKRAQLRLHRLAKNMEKNT